MKWPELFFLWRCVSTEYSREAKVGRSGCAELSSILPMRAWGGSQRTPCSNTGHEVPGPRVVSQCARSRRRRGEGADPRPDPYTGRDTSEHEVKRTHSPNLGSLARRLQCGSRAHAPFFTISPPRARACLGRRAHGQINDRKAHAAQRLAASSRAEDLKWVGLPVVVRRWPARPIIHHAASGIPDQRRPCARLVLVAEEQRRMNDTRAPPRPRSLSSGSLQKLAHGYVFLWRSTGVLSANTWQRSW